MTYDSEHAEKIVKIHCKDCYEHNKKSNRAYGSEDESPSQYLKLRNVQKRYAIEAAADCKYGSDLLEACSNCDYNQPAMKQKIEGEDEERMQAEKD